YLSLSMLPYFVSQVLNVTDVRMGINYGTEKIRFTAPVPVDSQVRLKATRRRDRDARFGQAGAGRRSAVPRFLRPRSGLRPLRYPAHRVKDVGNAAESGSKQSLKIVRFSAKARTSRRASRSQENTSELQSHRGVV